MYEQYYFLRLNEKTKKKNSSQKSNKQTIFLLFTNLYVISWIQKLETEWIRNKINTKNHFFRIVLDHHPIHTLINDMGNFWHLFLLRRFNLIHKSWLFFRHQKEWNCFLQWNLPLWHPTKFWNFIHGNRWRSRILNLSY